MPSSNQPLFLSTTTLFPFQPTPTNMESKEEQNRRATEVLARENEERIRKTTEKIDEMMSYRHQTVNQLEIILAERQIKHKKKNEEGGPHYPLV